MKLTIRTRLPGMILIALLSLGCAQLNGILNPGPSSKLLTSDQIKKTNLNPVIIIAGDLPEHFQHGQPTSTVPERFKDFPQAPYQLSVEITDYGAWAGNTTVLLYDNSEDIEKAFNPKGESYDESKAVAGLGERSSLLVFSIPYGTEGSTLDGANVFFVRCSAVVEVRLLTQNTSDASNYALQLDKRLTPIVCGSGGSSSEQKTTTSPQTAAATKAAGAVPTLTSVPARNTAQAPKYLSEIPPSSFELGYGKYSVGKFEFSSDDPNDRIKLGDPMILGGQTYPHGIFAHAPSRLIYKLDLQYQHLVATIGLVQNISCGDGAIFIVRVDGKEVYRSKAILARTTPVDIDVPINGGSTLILQADPGSKSDNQCDWAIWGDPLLK